MLFITAKDGVFTHGRRSVTRDIAPRVLARWPAERAVELLESQLEDFEGLFDRRIGRNSQIKESWIVH